MFINFLKRNLGHVSLKYDENVPDNYIIDYSIIYEKHNKKYL